MEKKNLREMISEISREKGLDETVLIQTMEQAILTAAKRTFGMERELEARFNQESGHVDLYLYMTVVDEVDDEDREISVENARRHGFEEAAGDELGFQIFYTPEDEARAKAEDSQYGDLLGIEQTRRIFGRIALQTAKQVIIQRMRDAERDVVYSSFKDRLGELISGTVRRFERGALMVELDHRIKGEVQKADAILPPREQTPRENHRPGDRVIALLKNIDREARGQQLVLSRADSQLVVKLFEMEVPEINEGIVRIVSAAREPGARTKIAVSSRDTDVDPVGACVGMKGSRVQAVVQELRGEKIDIVPWDRDPARFVCNAIAPAEVMRVIIDETNHAMELVVPDQKLSLAIGRRGQNVRLASQLTGWKLDIISESKFRQIEDDAIQNLSAIPGFDQNFAKSFYRSGFRTLEEVAEASIDELISVEGVGAAEKATEIQTKAKSAMEPVRRRRVEIAVGRGQSLTEREIWLLAPGMTERLVEILERGGYRGVEEVAKETDLDRISVRTGLPSSRLAELREGAQRFVATDLIELRTASRAAQTASEAQSETAPS